MLTPIAVRPGPDHHGQQPGRVRRGVLHDHRPRSVRGRSHPARRTSTASAPTDLLEDRDHRRRHARARRSSARRASRSASSASRSTSRARTSPRTPARRREPKARRLLLGRLPGRDRRSDRDPARVRQADRREDAAPARRVRRLRGRDSTRSPARRSCSSATARTGRARSATSRSRSRTSTSDRTTLDPHTAQAEDIFVKSAKTWSLLRKAKDKAYMRLKGCPVSVAEQVLALVQLSGAEDPTRDLSGIKQLREVEVGDGCESADGPQVPGPRPDQARPSSA